MSKPRLTISVDDLIREIEEEQDKQFLEIMKRIEEEDKLDPTLDTIAEDRPFFDYVKVAEEALQEESESTSEKIESPEPSSPSYQH